MIITAQASETGELYMSVVARPLNHLRIVVCRNGIQWRVQTRDSQRNGAARWKNRAFALTRPGLTNTLRRFAVISEHDAADIVSALPSRQPFADAVHRN